MGGRGSAGELSSVHVAETPTVRRTPAANTFGRWSHSIRKRGGRGRRFDVPAESGFSRECTNWRFFREEVLAARCRVPREWIGWDELLARCQRPNVH